MPVRVRLSFVVTWTLIKHVVQETGTNAKGKNGLGVEALFAVGAKDRLLCRKPFRL